MILAATIGLATTLVHDVPYLLRVPFWLDEAWVADTVRAPAGLTRSLAASTPVGWTYLLRLVPFGGPERLRLVPLAFAMIAVSAGYLLGRELGLNRYVTGVLTGASVLLSPAMLVRDDLKQYTAEACACLVIWVLVARAENRWSPGRLAAIAAVGSAGLLFADTLLFTGAAAMASLALECLVRRRYRRLLDVAAASVAMIIVSLAIYLALIRPSMTPQLAAYWRLYYVPVTSASAALDFVYRGLQSLAPYAGFRAPLIDALGAAAGIAALIWQRRIALAALLPVMLVIVISASAAGRYPFGDLRTSTFWLVIPPVLMAIAVASAGRMAGRLIRRGPASAPAALAAAAGLAVWVTATLPYVRSHLIPDEDVQSQVAYLNRHARPGDVVVVGLAASYGFAYYDPAEPSFPKGNTDNGFVISYPSRLRIVVLHAGTQDDGERALSEARAQIAAEPAAARGRIWIIRAHLEPGEAQLWNHLLAGQQVQSIAVGPDPILLYRYRAPGPVGTAGAPSREEPGNALR